MVRDAVWAAALQPVGQCAEEARSRTKCDPSFHGFLFIVTPACMRRFNNDNYTGKYFNLSNDIRTKFTNAQRKKNVIFIQNLRNLLERIS